ncbi:MAG: hypothetical protein UMV23_02555 [Halanaerobium sp.]|nr:hypothetical protein [Halanaerobium sp.]
MPGASREEKVDYITRFISQNPHSLASRSICRRLFGSDGWEVGQELSGSLSDKLVKMEDEYTIDSFYDLVK